MIQGGRGGLAAPLIANCYTPNQPPVGTKAQPFPKHLKKQENSL